jgi:uncharacterized protein (DUF433 family)
VDQRRRSAQSPIAIAAGTEGDERYTALMNWRQHITVDPLVCHGKPCFRGTRILVSVVLDNLAAGVPESEIATDYPGIGSDQLAAALAYAAELVRERVVSLVG